VIALATAMVVAILSQSADAERARAVDLARRGQTVEALHLFETIVARDPADAEARQWVARLDLRLGHLDKAEAGFRAVHAAHPGDIDPRIGLGAVLTRKGDLAGALEILEAAERDAGANVDLYGALALALRRAGDDGRAMDYYRRALALTPDDADIRDGYETLARTYGHGIAFEGLTQHVTPGSTVGSGSLAASLRVASRLHLEGTFRAQHGSGYSDALGGGGVVWRMARATNLSLRATGGSGNTALANRDVSAEVLHYVRTYEIGASVRALSFAGADVASVSPLFSVDPGGRWRADTRYTYSHARFAATGDGKGDHSGLVRFTWRRTPRVWTSGTYAYGIESFEDLTVDRIASLGAHTAAAGLRLNLRSLTVLNATWEHQWRSNDSRLDRVTILIAQFFP